MSTAKVMERLPAGWRPSVPLAFTGLRTGEFIARVSGDYQVPGARYIARHWEVEGYGTSAVEAIDDLARKLAAAYRDTPKGPEPK